MKKFTKRFLKFIFVLILFTIADNLVFKLNNNRIISWIVVVIVGTIFSIVLIIIEEKRKKVKL